MTEPNPSQTAGAGTPPGTGSPSTTGPSEPEATGRPSYEEMQRDLETRTRERDSLSQSKTVVTSKLQEQEKRIKELEHQLAKLSENAA